MKKQDIINIVDMAIICCEEENCANCPFNQKMQSMWCYEFIEIINYIKHNKSSIFKKFIYKCNKNGIYNINKNKIFRILKELQWSKVNNEKV